MDYVKKLFDALKSTQFGLGVIVNFQRVDV